MPERGARTFVDVNSMTAVNAGAAGPLTRYRRWLDAHEQIQLIMGAPKGDRIALRTAMMEEDLSASAIGAESTNSQFLATFG